MQARAAQALGPLAASLNKSNRTLSSPPAINAGACSRYEVRYAIGESNSTGKSASVASAHLSTLLFANELPVGALKGDHRFERGQSGLITKRLKPTTQIPENSLNHWGKRDADLDALAREPTRLHLIDSEDAGSWIEMRLHLVEQIQRDADRESVSGALTDWFCERLPEPEDSTIVNTGWHDLHGE